MKEIFPDAPITAYKRDSNLQDILVHKKHNKVLDRNNDSKCKKCSICKHITSKINFTKNDKTFTFNQHINCKMSNIVYGIYCNKCDEINYVGQTGTTIYERFQNHISSMKRTDNNPIESHYRDKRHSVQNLEIVCLEKIRGNDIHHRKIRESFWIQKLKTIHPYGLNKNLGIGDGIRREAN